MSTCSNYRYLHLPSHLSNIILNNCSVGSIVTMVVTNLNLHCVCVCETVVWEFRLYLFFHWVLQVLQVLTGFLTGETGFGWTTV